MPRDKKNGGVRRQHQRRRGKSQDTKKQERNAGKRNGSSSGKGHNDTTYTSSPFNAAFSSFVLGAASSAAAKATASLGSGWGSGKEDETANGQAGDFDLYLLAISWSPRFCCTNEKQCVAEGMDGLDDISVHGLWPAYTEADKKTGRTYPAFCNKTDAEVSTKGLSRREAHEWKKHGTCTVLSQSAYLEEEQRVTDGEEYDALRDLLADTALTDSDDPLERALPLAEVLDALGGEKRAAIMTDQFCRLAEITTCYAKAQDGSVGERKDCPAHVLGSSRNKAVLEGCRRVHLDPAGSCAYITKDFLKALKEV